MDITGIEGGENDVAHRQARVKTECPL
jgi:hypothetical protein